MIGGFLLGVLGLLAGGTASVLIDEAWPMLAALPGFALMAFGGYRRWH